MSAGPLEELLYYTHALAMLSASFYSIAIYCVFCEANSEKLVYGLATCQCNRTFQGLQFSWGWQGMQLCPFYKLLYGFLCKKLQFFSPLDHTLESILCFLYLINVCSLHLKYQFVIYNVVLQIEV